ncbi:hypothetical protein BD626DRAFT_492252 [Schizophyllum amplum]|uniref:Uncharacterized protein n=1 Tax=Schizophyllum amplum TaxID=97359 RepID=A0A550CIC9_9AGAR|nr:hypothetical protein BD626DRAFT_492252 [Auriculariopsis ampla]
MRPRQRLRACRDHPPGMASCHACIEALRSGGDELSTPQALICWYVTYVCCLHISARTRSFRESAWAYFDGSKLSAVPSDNPQTYGASSIPTQSLAPVRGTSSHTANAPTVLDGTPRTLYNPDRAQHSSAEGNPDDSMSGLRHSSSSVPLRAATPGDSRCSPSARRTYSLRNRARTKEVKSGSTLLLHTDVWSQRKLYCLREIHAYTSNICRVTRRSIWSAYARAAVQGTRLCDTKKRAHST